MYTRFPAKRSFHIFPSAGRALDLWQSDSSSDHADQPAASGTRRPKAYNSEVLILRLGEHQWVFTALAHMRPERREDSFRSGEELPGESSPFARLRSLGFEHRGTP